MFCKNKMRLSLFVDLTNEICNIYITRLLSILHTGISSGLNGNIQISFTDVSYAETMSDAATTRGESGISPRSFRRGKNEADRLRKEQKKRKREILKSKEEALRKQIEVRVIQMV